MTVVSSHLDEGGHVRMVDIGAKASTARTALAIAHVHINSTLLKNILDNNPKGDVLAVARIAGIQAAKKCWDLIPLCHPLSLNSVSIDLEVDNKVGIVIIQAQCSTHAATGVEMEALTAVSIAALTIYDMCKSADKYIMISDIALLKKTGGRSGDWSRDSSA